MTERRSRPRARGCLWLVAGLVVAIVAGVVGFVVLRDQMARVTPAEEEVPGVPVVVAARAVQVGTLLAAADVRADTLPPEAVPAGSLSDAQEAIGKVTLVDLYPGEIIVADRLVDPNVISGDGRTAVLLAEDDVLFAFPIRDLMSRIEILKPGDHVDMLFSLNFPVAGELGETEQVTFDLLQNVAIAAIVREAAQEGGGPIALLFTVSPQDALLLKYVKDAEGILDIVLRAPGAEGPVDTDPVDRQYLRNARGIQTGE